MQKTKFILDYILSRDGCTQEYPLLKHIEENHFDFFSSLGAKPSLFKKHFFLFHHLHRLSGELSEKNLCLIISPVEIRVCNIGEAGTAIGGTDALKEFYLNLDNLNMSDEEVNAMQQKFWQKFLALDKKAESIKLLGLENVTDLNREVLKKRFNEMAQQYHPDKGGDEERFVAIRQAYEDLKLLLK